MGVQGRDAVPVGRSGYRLRFVRRRTKTQTRATAPVHRCIHVCPTEGAKTAEAARNSAVRERAGGAVRGVGARDAEELL